MKLVIDIEKVMCEIEIKPNNDGTEHCEIGTNIHGQVYLKEGSLTVPLLAKEDRKELTHCLGCAFAHYIVDKMGYHIVEEGEDAV